MPGIKITIETGEGVELGGAHLHACENTMWQGIVVKDGAAINSYGGGTQSTLIEDAVTAIDVNFQTTPVINFLDVIYTVFNKNYIDINISGYNGTLSPIRLENCVFTCRDLPYTSGSWPTAGNASTLAGVNAQLRTAITSTNDLTPPYLSQTGFSVTTLKNPYASQSSNIAIQLNNFGVNSGTVMYGAIFGSTVVSDFNVFDSHDAFIFAVNSNIKLVNNVFQKTTGRNIFSPLIGGGNVRVPGAAVIDYVTTNFNANLNMSSSDFSIGNRFWNCHRGVVADNVYNLNIQHALFRSTQTTADAFYVRPGNTGVTVTSNRFYHIMRYNEFSNIMNGITENITSGTYTTVASPSFFTTGTYAALLMASDNTITATTATNAFANNAITISSPLTNTVNWTTAPDYNVVPSIVGYNIERNQINNVFRGIYVNGCGVGFPSLIDDNVVTLADDNVFYAAQHGIHVNGTFGKNVVGNNMAFSTTTVNPQQSLYYFANNLGIISPSISCNTARNCSKGFEFNSINGTTQSPMCTYWRGNDMETLKMGMALSGVTGIIGPQGENTGPGANPIDNSWLGTWTGNNEVFADNSNALNSPLVIKNGYPYAISGASGNGPNISEHYGAPGTIFNFNLGSYSCGDFSINKTMSLTPRYSDTKDLYISDTEMYRFLKFNDSIRAANPSLSDFYNDRSDSSYSKFLQIEDSLYAGKISEAESLISSISTINTVEANYKTYYSLYAAYAAVDLGPTNSEDSTNLLDLANLCPSIDGAIVYQARALFNCIYQNSFVFSDLCIELAAKLFYNKSEKSSNENTEARIKIFPNPASDKLTISTYNENESLQVVIRDLSNRIVFQRLVKIHSLVGNLELELVNGVYMITVIDQNNESSTKKLIIFR